MVNASAHEETSNHDAKISRIDAPRFKRFQDPSRRHKLLDSAAAWLYSTHALQDKAKLLLISTLINGPCSQADLEGLLRRLCPGIAAPDLSARLALLLREDTCFRQQGDGTILLHEGVLLGRFVASIAAEDQLALCHATWGDASPSCLPGQLAMAFVRHTSNTGIKGFAVSVLCEPTGFVYSVSGIQAGLLICKQWRKSLAVAPPPGAKPYSKLCSFLNADQYLHYDAATKCVQFDIAGLCGDGLLGLADDCEQAADQNGKAQQRRQQQNAPCNTQADAHGPKTLQQPAPPPQVHWPLCQQQQQQQQQEVLQHTQDLQPVPTQQQQQQQQEPSAGQQNDSSSDSEDEDILALLLSQQHEHSAVQVQHGQQEHPAVPATADVQPDARMIAAANAQPAPYWPFAAAQQAAAASHTSSCSAAAPAAAPAVSCDQPLQAVWNPHDHGQQCESDVRQSHSQTHLMSAQQPLQEQQQQQGPHQQPDVQPGCQPACMLHATDCPSTGTTQDGNAVDSGQPNSSRAAHCQAADSSSFPSPSAVHAAAAAAIDAVWPAEQCDAALLQNALAKFMLHKGKAGLAGGKVVNICQAGDHLQRCWRQHQQQQQQGRPKPLPYSKLLPFLTTCHPFIQLRAEPGREQCVYAWLDVQRLAAEGRVHMAPASGSQSSISTHVTSTGSASTSRVGQAHNGSCSHSAGGDSYSSTGSREDDSTGGRPQAHSRQPSRQNVQQSESATCKAAGGAHALPDIDAVWPPGASAQDLLKGQLAKHMLAAGAAEGVFSSGMCDKLLPLPAAGKYLTCFWKQHQKQLNAQGNSTHQPWSLKTLFRGDALFSVVPDSSKPGSFHVKLRAGQLLARAVAAPAAARSAAVMPATPINVQVGAAAAGSSNGASGAVPAAAETADGKVASHGMHAVEAAPSASAPQQLSSQTVAATALQAATDMPNTAQPQQRPAASAAPAAAAGPAAPIAAAADKASSGSSVSVQTLCACCDAVWPPGCGLAGALKRELAKHMLTTGTGIVCLANGNKATPLWRAAMFLKACWRQQLEQQEQGSSHGASFTYANAKVLLEGDEHFLVLPHPRKPNSFGVTLLVNALQAHGSGVAHGSAGRAAGPSTGQNASSSSSSNSNSRNDSNSRSGSRASVPASLKAAQPQAGMQAEYGSPTACPVRGFTPFTPEMASQQVPLKPKNGATCELAHTLYGRRRFMVWRPAGTTADCEAFEQQQHGEAGAWGPREHMAAPSTQHRRAASAQQLPSAAEMGPGFAEADVQQCMSPPAQPTAAGSRHFTRAPSAPPQLPSDFDLGPGFESGQLSCSQLGQEFDASVPGHPPVSRHSMMLSAPCHNTYGTALLLQHAAAASSSQATVPSNSDAAQERILPGAMPNFAQMPGMLAAALRPDADDASLVRWWCAMGLVRAANPELQLWSPSARQPISADAGRYELLLSQAGQLLNKLWSNQPDERPAKDRPWTTGGMSLKALLGGGGQQLLHVVTYNDRGNKKVVLDLAALLHMEAAQAS